MTVHQGALALTGEATLAALPTHSYVAMVSNPRRQLVYAVEIATRQVGDHRPVPGGSTTRTPLRANLTLSRFAPTRVLSNVADTNPLQGNLVLSGVVPTVTTWTPLNLGSDLIGWYDATDSVYNSTIEEAVLATDGQPAITWVDKSGHDHHVFRRQGGSEPTFRASSSIMNNRPTVEFEQFVTMMNGTASLGLGEQSMSMFAVFSAAPTQLHNDNRIVSFKADGDLQDYSSSGGLILFETFYPENDDTFAGFRLHPTLNNGGHFGHQHINHDTPYRGGAIVNKLAATIATYLNGVEEIVSFSAWGENSFGNQDTGGGGTIAIGGNSGTEPAQWGGCISEVVWLRRALSSTERSTLDNYFRSKWGFS